MVPPSRLSAGLMEYGCVIDKGVSWSVHGNTIIGVVEGGWRAVTRNGKEGRVQSTCSMMGRVLRKKVTHQDINEACHSFVLIHNSAAHICAICMYNNYTLYRNEGF